MRFRSTRAPGSEGVARAGAARESGVGFREAIFTGLAPDGGLYHPLEWPDLGGLFASFGPSTPFPELAARTLHRLLAPELSEAQAARIARRAFPFSPLLRPLDREVTLLELFHGPTCAFKDFGASFLACAMDEFLRDEGRRAVILVATSGDTGSAVAHAFHGKEAIDVVILYPSGRVSPLQELQLTTLGGNVAALEVEGSFDDCQRLVKEAFLDPRLRAELALTSANSINLGRLIPQSFYYLFAGAQGAGSGAAGPLTFCVPSGNFGNLTAGVYAWKWGLPVQAFLAATNRNDIVPRYLSTGVYSPRASLATLSNAMDVGSPSNFERLSLIFGGDVERMRALIRGGAVSDADTLEAIGEERARSGVLLDPHTAVGVRLARRWLAENPGSARPVIVLATAHPAKFGEIVKQATGIEPVLPEPLREVLERPKRALRLANRFADLSAFLLQRFARG